MTYRILADLLVVFHVGFLLFVGLGGVLAFWRRWMARIHIPAAVWGVLIELGGWVCPLTPLENRFRRLGGDAGYAGSFIEHYVVPILYPQGLTRGHQIGIGVVVGMFNLVVYGILLRRIREERREGGVSENPGAGSSADGERPVNREDSWESGKSRESGN